jgi:hypothetical protein
MRGFFVRVGGMGDSSAPARGEMAKATKGKLGGGAAATGR